jgi:ATP phosphoribosyltransferase regulatory subunit
MTDHAPLRELFEGAGYGFVEPPILYDASVFVEPLGEDLRRRLFLTADQDGREMALRPDFTIPVALHHLATGPAKRRAGYAYLGPVFRQRAEEPDEFLQAGVESLGRADRDEADADLLRLAFDALATLGVSRPTVRIGDSGLFAAVLDALALDPPWRRRLARAFGNPARLRTLVARAAEDGGDAAEIAASPARIRREVEALFAKSGLGMTGRTPSEIAARHAEKAALAAGVGPRAAAVLTRFLAIGGPAEAAAVALRELAGDEGLRIAPSLDRFAARLDAFAARDIALDRLTFAADFGRRLDYYTGFVFEMYATRRAPRPVVGGGRYDRLVSLLARLRHETAVTVPAIGFSLWLDRVGGPR